MPPNHSLIKIQPSLHSWSLAADYPNPTHLCLHVGGG